MERTKIIAQIGLLVVAIFIILFSLFFGLATTFHKATVTDKVLGKERVVYSSSNSKYLIYGNNETYQDTDSLWLGKFNSSDLYGHIQTGHTYQFTVIGWRVPFLSWYRNIISDKELN